MNTIDYLRQQAGISTVYLTENRCFQRRKRLNARGVMVHSTGANNPRLSRYIAPNDGRLGKPSRNNWNQYKPGGRSVCVHGFVGKLADGSVAAYQTLPWLTAGWHCAGKANDTHIGFEICEDACDPSKLECWQYLAATYSKAAFLTAYLCAKYHFNPMQDGVVLCHAEGHRRGWASNHGDVIAWWSKFGVTMDMFRRDVSRLLNGAKGVTKITPPENLLPRPTVPEEKEDDDMITYEQWMEYKERYEKEQAAKEATMPKLAKEAEEMGIFDGRRPRAGMTREEGAVMNRRVQLNTENTTKTAVQELYTEVKEVMIPEARKALLEDLKDIIQPGVDNAVENGENPVPADQPRNGEAPGNKESEENDS